MTNTIANGTVTQHGYQIEARVKPEHKPILIGTKIYDSTWTVVDFQTSNIGVPSSDLSSRHKLSDYGLLNYNAAECIRWWFLASVEDNNYLNSTYFETRLVKYKLETSYKVEKCEDQTI